jgi:hypothetical protein
LLAYAVLLDRIHPKNPVIGAAIHWVDYGKLEVVNMVGVNV